MLPALQPGDWLIARRPPARPDWQPRPGEIVALTDPRDGRAIVKRVDWCDAGYVSVLGDNLAASRDSRHFGPVEIVAVESVVIFRYWPPRRIGRVR